MREKEGDARWIGEGITSLEDINARIMAPIFAPAHTWRWWVALAFSGSLTLLMIVTVTWLFAHGIGIFGNNTTIVWGFPIANYVWWLGIGHAGTLISALLLLTRQKWRGSLNRFAETMTLFAASMAGLFPIFHLGRPYYLYWIVPYPNVQDVWPQWRSALVWDFWAVGTYITFSALFWYAGLIPDLAMLRERANSRFVRRLYGAFALGWRGSARHWQVHDRLYRYMAALAVPLVVSVHSIVSLDFAASLEPGWSDTIYPPYFVVGALYSGFAMVVVLAAALRWGCSFQPFITVRHFEVIARVLLTASIIMGVSYASEWFWGCATSIVVHARPTQHSGGRGHFHNHQHRHVAGTDIDRLGHAFARLPAEFVAYFPADLLGLGAAVRFAGRVHVPVSAVRAHSSGITGARIAQALDRGE
jgi:molybdopterin-containing oxidoreductase family membrane subunit